MEQDIYLQYVQVLNEELVAALGCTEPIAIAYAGALAREQLGAMPEQITAFCSGNIIKNVKGVTVPNSGGQKGVEAAAILGALGGDPQRRLEVLTRITPEQIQQSRVLAEQKICRVELVEGVANLYVRIEARAGGASAVVEIAEKHTNVVRIAKNGVDIVRRVYTADDGSAGSKRDFMSVDGILDFADAVRIEDVKPLLDQQIECNMAIAEEGLHNSYGANVGRNILAMYGGGRVETRARAYAAAGSDARMSGCDMPVVINSGSGNQGITVTVPVVQYARELGAPDAQLYRAMVISNLVAVHLKTGIGPLSAFCGAVSAAAGSGAAISYLCGRSRRQIKMTISNTLGTISGMVCDGAKASCAAKIASAVETAIVSGRMAALNDYFHGDEGILGESIEGTVRNIGRLGRKGMAETDIEILKMMIGQ